VNNHNHNNGEPRLDETPAVDSINARKSYCIGEMEVPIWRGSDPSVQSTGSLSGTGLSGSDRNVRCEVRSSDGVSKGICQHHHRQCACKDNTMLKR
jgi:hypothetical protein